MKKCLLLLLIPVLGYSQYFENLTYGLKLGAIRSTITNIPEMLIGREHHLSQFTMEAKEIYGVEGGVFLNYKFPDSRVAIQPEVMYRTGGVKIFYNNESINQKYNLKFNYSYLLIGGVYKLYPYQGFNFGIGGFYSKILTPNAVEYNSNEYNGLYDTKYRQFYKDGIVGQDDFNLSFSLGYELRQSFHFDLRYYLGVGDMIKSHSTTFQFLENTNRNSFISLALGYSFDTW
ncbi:PorT family protein [Ornithobacterium rhinotracheale]|uniref:outer membrane beta-barrel protein n=1 Tax=Ornithobacterium rhinotracheale TaxID=28251 RepID=UPI001FF0ECB5|nr:outer membrane beta-barrel protein [Ornithobacterium rhinotracheale]MCK0202725.1 PorT family protein [Ornithobacterium rhinotracheale]